MLHPPRSLLPLLALLTACTATSSDPDDVTDASAGASTHHDDPSTTTPTDGDASSDAPTTTSPASTTEADPTITTATTEDTTLAATTDETGGVSPGCGDGHVDPGEDCDFGHAENSNSAACTLDCTTATCGDGFVWTDHEDCDRGDDNYGEYGGCRPDCSLAAHCGDGSKNGPEQCDQGRANGTGEHPLDGVPCSPTCYHEASLVFLSSAVFPAAMGGAQGADKHCQALAEAAGLYGGAPFMAWISDFESSPAFRFEPGVPGRPYALLSGLRIAQDRSALFTSGPEDGITMTETGETIYKALVWTATNPDGTKLIEDLDCDDWTESSPPWKGSVGRSGVPKQDTDDWKTWKAGQHWTTFKTIECFNKYRLYCIEQ